MNVTRRTRRAHVVLATALVAVVAAGLVTAAPGTSPAPSVVAGGSGHCC